jgi:high-affinity Fe2+/Pb2+ permease
LTFGWLPLVAGLTPSAILIAGVVQQQGYSAHRVDPTVQNEIFWVAVVIALAFSGFVAWFFYWGAKSILRARKRSAMIFLTIVAAMHLGWVYLFGLHLAPINWFSVVTCCIATVLVFIRRKRLFT